jgi:hypothetical protein
MLINQSCGPGIEIQVTRLFLHGHATQQIDEALFKLVIRIAGTNARGCARDCVCCAETGLRFTENTKQTIKR